MVVTEGEINLESNDPIYFVLTISSYASLTAVNASTPINGIAVVIGVNDDIAGISCSNSKHKK